MAEEQGAFDFGDVVEAITAKLIRRHPHVFGDAEGRTAEARQRPVGAHQGRGKGRARRGGAGAGALDGVPVALPALTRALKLQDKAGRVGFDWNDPRAVLAKIREEADEIEAELDRGRQEPRRRPRSAICCSRWSTSPAISVPIRKAILRGDQPSNSSAASPRSSARWPRAARRRKDATLAEMDALWDEAKAARKARSYVAALRRRSAVSLRAGTLPRSRCRHFVGSARTVTASRAVLVHVACDSTSAWR